MINEMGNREIFSYKFGAHYAATSWICKTCCCRKKERKDRLFTDAMRRLNGEIDILEITKNTRIMRLVQEMKLNYRQRELTKFF